MTHVLTNVAGRRRWLLVSLVVVAALLLGRGAALAQINETGDLSIELVDPKVLRVCADPRNLPFSNEKGEGFENKLAELFADKLQKKLDYMYFPQATGFVRMTLGAHRCDVIMGFPQGDELVQGTNPYYRTAYALVAKPGSGLDEVNTLDDARLKGKHIGIVAGTPPATNMAANGLMVNAKPYPLMIDTRFDSSAEAMIGDLDVRARSMPAFCGARWRAFMPSSANPPLHVTPLVKETTGPRLTFRIGMGVRPRRPELEAAAQSADPGKSAGDQQDPARLRRSLARRERPAARFGDRNEIAMMRELAGLVLAMIAIDGRSSCAANALPEPDQYRTENYRAPVPATLAGARVLTTAEAETIWRAKTGVFIDVLPRAPKPPNLPAGTVWRDKPRLNIPGSVWLPDTGYGKLAAATEDYLKQGLETRFRRQRRRAARGLLPAGLLDVLERGQTHPVVRLSQCGVVSGRHRRLGVRRPAAGGIAAGAPRGRGGATAALSANLLSVSHPSYFAWGCFRDFPRSPAALFHFLLNRAAERKQPLVDRGRHLADEFDHAPPVLENPGLPDQLIAEFVDLGLIGRRRILQRLQGERIGADFVRGLALLAHHPFEPVHDRRALRIEGIEQAGEQQLALAWSCRPRRRSDTP